MGLDMYLEKRTYVKNWDHQTPEERHTVTVTGPSETSSNHPSLLPYSGNGGGVAVW